MLNKLNQLETDFNILREKDTFMRQTIRNNEITIQNQQKIIEDLSYRIDELDAFKLTCLDSTVHQLAEHEELLFTVQESEKMRKINSSTTLENSDLPTFGGVSFNQDADNKNNQTSLVHVCPSDYTKDMVPVSSYMRAMTNEIFFLYNENEGNGYRPSAKKVKGGSKPIDPKIPQSPAFYTSSDILDNSTFHIVSSKGLSSTDSHKQQKSGETSTTSEVHLATPKILDVSKCSYKRYNYPAHNRYRVKDKGVTSSKYVYEKDKQINVG